MPKIRVLIVDDAVVVRQILTGLLASDPDIEVVGTAANGKIALQKLPQLNPDLVTLDVEMPEMDGLTTLREIRKITQTLPIIMFSTLTERGASATIDALSAGASDYVTKPANVGSVNVAMQRIKDELIPKIKSLAARALVNATTATTAPTVRTPALARAGLAPKAPTSRSRIEALAIGVSTGGPNALSVVIPALPKTLGVPVFIVQHMPPLFTKFLADRLSANSALKVCEAAAGMKVEAGTVYVAPGDFHMVLERRASGLFIALNQQTPENSCRPAVDVLFRSVAKEFGSRMLAVMLTGMGTDGLRGSEAICAAGGRILAQDQATSIVWSMPGAVINAGLAERVLPLDLIGLEVARIVNASNATSSRAVAS